MKMLLKFLVLNKRQIYPELLRVYVILRMSAYNIIFGVIFIFCASIGTPLNLANSIYYIRSKLTLDSLIYRCITINDMIICINGFFLAVTSLNPDLKGVFGLTIMCKVWIILWEWIMKNSIFFTLMLSITRTIRLVKPFCIIRIRTISVILIIMVIVHVAVPAAIQYSNEMTYVPQFGWCIPESEEETVAGVLLRSNIVLSNILLYIILPVLIVSISCVISCVTLLLKRQISTVNVNVKASVMIVILTFAILVFNIHILVYTFTARREANYFLKFRFFFIITVVMNSTVNPIILLWRTTKVMLPHFRCDLCFRSAPRTN